MKNNEMFTLIAESCTVSAPDTLPGLTFEAAEAWRNTTPKISAKKNYITAGVIYAAACIAVLIAIPFIIGGGHGTDNPTPAVSETDEYFDSTEYDLNGEEFVILCNSWTEDMLKNDSYNNLGDGVEQYKDSAGYCFSMKKAERFEAAEERFGINITVEVVDDPAFETVARDQAGQTVNNAVFAQGTYFTDAILEGYIYDLNEIDTIDLTKSYWLPSTVESLTVADKLFLASGMITFDPIANSDFVVFNNDLIKELKLDSPYELVKSDTWSYDALLDMVLAAEKDLDGDGKIGLSDRHGGFFGGDLLNKMWQAPLCEKNTDNTYTYSPYSESGILGYSKYKSRVDNISYAFEEYESMGNSLWDFEYFDNVLYKSFREGRALFVSNEYVGNYYGGSENSLMNRLSDNAGVVPYPRVSDEYEYYTEMGLDAGLLAVPAGVEDPDMTGRILDYLAYASEKLLYDEYFDWCLKNEENGQNNVEMLKLILDSTVYDWANLFIPAEYADLRYKTLVSGGFSSVLKRYFPMIQKKVDDAIQKINSISYGKMGTDEEDVVFGYRNLFLWTHEYVPDAEKKNAYAKEYMYNVAKSGEITVMPELAVMLESPAQRLLAVSFTAFEEDCAEFVDTDMLRAALIGDKSYIVPDFADDEMYVKNIPENEILIYMTAEEFMRLTPPEKMKVFAGLAEFPSRGKTGSEYAKKMDDDDTVLLHYYLDLYRIMEYDDAMKPASEDKWDIFTFEVERYYDLQIPEEYRGLLADGTIFKNLIRKVGKVGDFTVIPELCKIQIRVDKETFKQSVDLNYRLKDYYVMAPKTAQ